MKSPNIISTTGRIPVMAAPTPMPLMPASDMGESITRFVPNSFARPESTLNGVPASATSSAMINTRRSRRISSANASLMAWPKVISRTGFPLVMAGWFSSPWPSPSGGGNEDEGLLGVDMLIDFVWVGIRCIKSEVYRLFDFHRDFIFDLIEQPTIRHFALL